MKVGKCKQSAVVSLVARLGAAATKNRPLVLRTSASTTCLPVNGL
jgi:hypothetical protein